MPDGQRATLSRYRMCTGVCVWLDIPEKSPACTLCNNQRVSVRYILQQSTRTEMLQVAKRWRGIYIALFLTHRRQEHKVFGRLVDRAFFSEVARVSVCRDGGVAALAPAATQRACEQQIAVQPPCDTLRLSVLAQPSTCEAHHRPQQRILFRRSSPHDLPVAADPSPPCRRVRRVPATPARRAWARTAGGPGPAGRAPRSRLSAPLSWSHTAGGRLEAARRVQVGYRARHGRS